MRSLPHSKHDDDDDDGDKKLSRICKLWRATLIRKKKQGSRLALDSESQGWRFPTPLDHDCSMATLFSSANLWPPCTTHQSLRSVRPSTSSNYFEPSTRLKKRALSSERTQECSASDNETFRIHPSTTQAPHSSMPHSYSAASGWAIAEQQAVSPLGCRPLDDLALCGADCASSARDRVMKVRCSVKVVSVQLDWTMAGVWSSMRREAIAAW